MTVDSHLFPLTGEERWLEPLTRQLANLRPGAHVCPLYDTVPEHIRALVPFLRAGLARGEQCLYIGDALSRDELVARVAAAEAELKEGALVVLPARETYLDRDGRFDPDVMLERWAAWWSAARDKGFAGVCVSGSASWALEMQMDFDRFIEYEARLNDFLGATGARVMCHYEFGQFQAGIIRNVLRTHPLAIVGEHVYDNVYFEPAALVLGGADFERPRVEWMRSQLRARARRDIALADVGRLALDGASPAGLMSAVAHLIAAEMQVDSVEMFDLLPTGAALRLVASAGLEPIGLGRIEPVAPDSPLASGALRVGQPLIISDWSQETRFPPPEWVDVARITSSASFVISTGLNEPIYGVLSVHSTTPRILSEDETVFLETVSISLGHAIARQRSEDELRALIEHSPDPIVRFDDESRITYVNPAAERLTGRPVESLLGRTSREMGMVEASVTTWELVLRQVWRTRREQTTEYRLRTPQGERILQSRLVPEFSQTQTQTQTQTHTQTPQTSDVERAVESVLTVARDVTELKRAQTEFERLSGELLEREQRHQELLGRLLSAQQEENRRLGRATVLQQLSARERAILQFIAQGRTNAAIARELQLSSGTVKNHITRLLRKLNAADRAQAAARAGELGLATLSE